MIRIITLLSFVAICLSNTLSAQKLQYETTSPWFWGMNVGAAWNTTDVKNETNAGWGFMLGRSFNFDYGNVFSFDLRGRYLGGSWLGQDYDSVGFKFPNNALSSGITNYKDSLGYGINNFRTKVREVDLELAIHLNKLVARTGFDPYIFGGIGLTWYKTKGNLLDDKNVMYDYNSLNTFTESGINSLLDNSYETNLDGSSNRFNVAVMPSLGFGLGYYFGKRFSMGIEHKTTFTLMDDFDGYINSDVNYANNDIRKNDLYHYTSIYFKHYFKYRGDDQYSTINNNNPNTNTVVNGGTADCQKPIIRINAPTNNSTVKNQNLTVQADVAHVLNLKDIILTVNGSATTNFSYSNKTNKLIGNGLLNVGQNTIVITATNSCGSTTETVMVNYEVDCQTPIVRFTNPLNSGATVSEGTYYVTAEVLNLTQNQGLIFKVNGVNVTTYSFNPSSGKFSATVNLTQGVNTFELNATNNCGSISGSTQLTYLVNCPAPIISGINTVNVITSKNEYYTVTAQFKNVTSANQIYVTVNGIGQNQGRLNSNSGQYDNSVKLNKGQNTIEIKATNTCGSTTETVVVNYELDCQTPIVRFTNPLNSGVSSSSGTYYVTADVLNMTQNQGVNFKINGVGVTNYSFNPSTGKFSTTVNLTKGQNTFELTAANNCGTISTSTQVIYTVNCPAPIISGINTVNGTNVENEYYTISAQFRNITSANQVSVTVNGIAQNQGQFNSNSGQYQNTVRLNKGQNAIEITVLNNCGRANEIVVINYTERCIVPFVAITNPSISGSNVENANYTFTATVANMSSNQGVSLKLNGNTITNYQFNTQTNQLVANLVLQQGSNTIELKAINNCGNGIAVTAINYNYNCPKPTIQFLNPNGTTSAAQKTFTVQAIVSNVNTANQIQFRLNGVLITQGSFNPSNGMLTATVQLSSGTNQLELIATNECGTMSSNATVMYREVVVVETLPTISMTGTCDATVQPGTQHISGLITGITNQSQVSIRLNDVLVSDVTYASSSLGMSFGFNMNALIDPSVYVIVVTATNTAGTITKTCVIKVNQPIDNDITICVLVNRIPTTKVIKQSEWPTYQAQGASLGKCPEVVDNDIEICVTENGKKVTKTIKQSEWLKYQSQGASLGKCPPVVKPIISMTGVCNVSLIAGTHIVSGLVTGITNQNEVSILVNDVPVNNVSYTSSSAGLSFTYDLVVVAQSSVNVYTITVQATNSAGTTTKTCVIKVNPIVDNDIEICVTENGKKVTKTIKQSEWLKYQSQGASLGKCPPVVKPIVSMTGVCNVSLSAGTHTVSGLITGIENQNEVSILVNDVPVNNVSYTSSSAGLSFTYDLVVVAQSSVNVYTITVQATNSAGTTTKTCVIKVNPIVDNDIEICVNENGKKVTKTIKQSEWLNYQSQGATLGKCPVVDNDITICILVGRIPTTKVIKESEWPKYQSQGASLGKCPEVVDNDIEICVNENGKKVTKTIKQSEWLKYQSQGATLGKCPVVDNDITICVLVGRIPTTKVIKESEWPYYQSQGASLGICPETKKIVDRVGSKEMSIKDSTMIICVLEKGILVTKTINVALWPEFQKLGATEGACEGSKKEGKQIERKVGEGEMKGRGN